MSSTCLLLLSSSRMNWPTFSRNGCTNAKVSSSFLFKGINMFADEMLEQPHLNHSCVIMSGLDCTKIAERVHSAHNSSKIRRSWTTWHLDSRLPQDLDGPTTQYSVGKYLQKRCPVERVWNVWNLRIQKFRSRKDSSWAALKDWAAENTTASGRNFRIFRPLKASEKTINQMGLFSGRSVCTSMNLRQTKDGRTPKLILNKSAMIWSISSVNEVFSAVEELLPEPVFQASKMQCKVQ